MFTDSLLPVWLSFSHCTKTNGSDSFDCLQLCMVRPWTFDWKVKKHKEIKAPSMLLRLSSTAVEVRFLFVAAEISLRWHFTICCLTSSHLSESLSPLQGGCHVWLSRERCEALTDDGELANLICAARTNWHVQEMGQALNTIRKETRWTSAGESWTVTGSEDGKRQILKKQKKTWPSLSPVLFRFNCTERGSRGREGRGARRETGTLTLLTARLQ